MKTCCRFQRGATFYGVHGCVQLSDGPRRGALTALTLTTTPTFALIRANHYIGRAGGSGAVPKFVLIRADRYVDRASGSVGGAATSFYACTTNVALQSYRAPEVRRIIMKLEHVNRDIMHNK